MPVVAITEDKKDFYKIIKRVMQGEVFVITRLGTPVVRLMSIPGAESSAPTLRERMHWKVGRQHEEAIRRGYFPPQSR